MSIKDAVSYLSYLSFYLSVLAITRGIEENILREVNRLGRFETYSRRKQLVIQAGTRDHNSESFFSLPLFTLQ